MVDGGASQKRQVILVTGACGDIGSAIVRALHAGGALLIPSDYMPSEMALAGMPAEVSERFVQCDVRDAHQIDGMFEAILAMYGRVDSVVCAAGVVDWTPILDIAVEQWERVISTNLTGCFLVARGAAARMKSGGSLVFIGSWIGAHPARNLASYCTAKAGVEMISRCLALELGPLGIRSNVVAPGIVDAGVSAQVFRASPERRDALERVIPLGSLGTSEQIADAVRFLLSPAAIYVTGSTLTVDGGIHLAHEGG